MLLGAQINVDTAITTSGGSDTWKADFNGGSTTSIASAGTSGTLNTKVNTLIVPEITNASTEVRLTAPGVETFSAGIIEVVVYYITLSPLSDA